MELSGRVAIVTGAGAGLGRAHALELARHGAKVIINDIGPGADDVAAEIIAAGGEAIGIRGSVTDEAAVAAMVAETVSRWGRVDILVNNAGILRDKTFAKISLDDFRLVIEVHLIGSFICTKAVWGLMREQAYGRIVMTTSSSGLFGNFGQSNYGAAKMGLVGLMQVLSLEGEKYNIRVNSLAPTAATAMLDGLVSEENKAAMAPEHVSPGLIRLVGEDAPTRAILCAGSGHFSRAYITLTGGAWIGDGDGAAEAAIAHWDEIGDRTHEIVPEHGGLQSRQQIAARLKEKSR
jgi:NAD(P)-dependent dehydrogenase (short-subunit alcohol dehydrogenase family)